jgi:DNA processing protein
MMTDIDLDADFELILSFTPSLGSSGISRILARNAISGRTPKQFMSLSESTFIEEYALKPRAAQALANGARELEAKVKNYKERIAGKPVRLATIQSALYPARIESFCENPPAYVFLYGNCSVLDNKTFCVLASRDSNRSVEDRVEQEVERGVLEPKTLVTGANTGAYMRGAVVPLRWGAPRILVLDRGLFAALGDNLDQEPFPAARLWRYKFDPMTDLVVSAFRPDDHFIGSNNQIRDELVVALSDDVVVVRARPGGVMERLADRADRIGKSVTKIG